MKRIFKVIFNMSFIFYLLALVFILFFGSRGYLWSDLSLLEYIKRSSNFVPFKTINTYITALFDGSMNVDIPIKNLGGNFVLFLPMGIYLPYLIKKLNTTIMYSILMILLLLIIELIQLVTRRGVLDIDDFILNMFGALVGFRVWKSKVIYKYIK